MQTQLSSLTVPPRTPTPAAPSELPPRYSMALAIPQIENKAQHLLESLTPRWDEIPLGSPPTQTLGNPIAEVSPSPRSHAPQLAAPQAPPSHRPTALQLAAPQASPHAPQPAAAQAPPSQASPCAPPVELPSMESTLEALISPPETGESVISEGAKSIMTRMQTRSQAAAKAAKMEEPCI